MINIKGYVEVTKPKTVILLVFTSLTAMMVASSLNEIYLTTELWLSAIIAITAGCAGCNAVTCYVDRDIDAVMLRTQKRPLVSGKINPPQNALYFGIALLVLSVTLSLIRNFLSFAVMVLGIFDNIVIYSLLLKRRNPINIILGGVSGGLPTAFGWAYISESLSLMPLVMAALVILWIPNHIWSLALFHKEDYERAGIPMLPVVVEERKALRYIVSTSILLVFFSLLLFLTGLFGLIYLLIASVLGATMLLLNLWLFLRPSTQNASVVFKFSSPYLAIVFLAMIIDVLV